MELKTTLSPAFFNRFCPDPTVMYDLGELYAEFNAKYFYGELPLLPCATKVDKNGETRNVYGTLKWDGRLGKTTLGIYKRGTIYLNRKIAKDPIQTRSVLLHEMLHKFLDVKGWDDGIAGHGPNFIKEAKRINESCATRCVQYRVHYYDVPVTRAEPTYRSDLIGEDIHCVQDLDLARKMGSVIRAAFDTKYDYLQ
jgi:hypothetical protein